MKKNKYSLMGRYVQVKSYMKPAKEFCARSYRKYALGESRVGMVVGYRTVYEGKIKSPNYNPEDFVPGYLEVTKSIKVLLVCFWPTYKPVLVLPEDVVTDIAHTDNMAEYLRPTFRPWSEKDRAEERKYAAEMKRDSKGRWIK